MGIVSNCYESVLWLQSHMLPCNFGETPMFWNPVPGLEHRSITPKFVTPTALSCIDNSWRSTTLSPPTKLTSSTANLEWCHVHFIRDSYSTFIRRVIGPSKNSMELFCKAKFDFKSTWNRDSATSHHKHPVCQSPVGKAEKLTNVWSRYFGPNRIIDNWHRCLGVMWRKRKNISINNSKKNLWTLNFYFIDSQNYLHIMRTFLNHIKKWNFGWNWNITRKFVATNDPVIWVFPILIRAHSETEVSGSS